MVKTGSKLTNLSDIELVQLALENNQNAFNELYIRHLFGVTYRISCFGFPKEDIEELTQDSFNKAFKKLNQFDPHEGPFQAWIYKIARNTALDHISKHKRMKNQMLMDDVSELKEMQAEMQSPEEDIIIQQEHEKLLNNIEKLKDDYRIVAKMNLIDFYGYQEIADTLEMPLNTVKTKIHRAKEQLKKMMDLSDELL